MALWAKANKLLVEKIYLDIFQGILRQKELKTKVEKPALASLSELWQPGVSFPDRKAEKWRCMEMSLSSGLQEGLETEYPRDSYHRIPEPFPSLRQGQCPTHQVLHSDGKDWVGFLKQVPPHQGPDSPCSTPQASSVFPVLPKPRFLFASSH